MTPATIPVRSLDLLTDLGEAYRADWTDFDGRALRDDLYEIASLTHREATGDDVTQAIAAFRMAHGLAAAA